MITKFMQKKSNVKQVKRDTLNKSCDTLSI
jgi:hypothetical protein